MLFRFSAPQRQIEASTMVRSSSLVDLLTRAAATLALLLTLAPSQAYAWGREGHEIVAAAAESMLTSEVSAKAGALLAAGGGETFVRASDWADRIRRQHRETAPWHFVDTEVGEGPYDPARDCPKRACVVEKITEFTARLGDRRLDPETRGEALKWVIHLVADLHQPLHSADRHDRGGNALHVVFLGRERNLHELWDTELVRRLAGRNGVNAYASRLAASVTAADRAAWAKGTAADWANESHAVAESVAYGALPGGEKPVITEGYERTAERAIELQLKRAAVRLAWLLDTALR